MNVAGFDWDEGNRAKCERHGVPLPDIEALLSGTPRVVPDVAHSTRETRFIAIGRTMEGRAIFVAFAVREKDAKLLIRPISARFMHKKESDAYGNEGTEAHDG